MNTHAENINFAGIATLLRKHYGVRCYINTNRQEIILVPQGPMPVVVIRVSETEKK
jgi:hypothetical protein